MSAQAKRVPSDDDTLRLEPRIISHSASSQGHIVYTIEVRRYFHPAQPPETWTVQGRYSALAQLRSSLQADSGLTLSFPPKKTFGNTSEAFVERRKAELQEFLNEVAQNPVMNKSRILQAFLRSTSPTHPEAGNSAMFLRSARQFARVCELPDIGWRLSKDCKQVEDASGNIGILHWIPCASAYVDAAILKPLLQHFSTLAHPHIHSASMLATVHQSDEPRAVLVRPLCPKGSVRDLVCRCKAPTAATFAHKYSRSSKPLDANRIATYAKQILLALDFLHKNNIPFGHLHSGNVMIVSDKQCALSDIENGLLGLPPLLRRHVISQPHLNTLEKIDVFCFAHVLFEMATGRALKKPVLSGPLPPKTPAGALVERLLLEDAVSKLPSASDLLQDTFFSKVPPLTAPEGTFKQQLGPKGVEALQQACKQMLRTIRVEQKAFFDSERKAKQAKKAEERRKLRETKAPGSSDGLTITISSPRAQHKEMATHDAQASAAPSAVQSQPASSSQAPPSTPAAPQGGAAPVAPPPPPPPAVSAPPPPADAPSQPPPSSSGGRGALLGSIQSFSKNKLKKSDTNDRSAPTV